MFIKIFQILLLISTIAGMLPEEKSKLRLQVLEMFQHGFGAYMVKEKDKFKKIIFLFIEICLSCG